MSLSTKFSLMLLLFGGTAFYSMAGEINTLPKQEISAIESTIALPKGAYSLGDYDRYYSIIEVNGVKKLVGMYLHKKTKNPGIHWIAPNSMPMMMDGGCAAIDMEYDLVNKKLLRMFCHGVA